LGGSLATRLVKFAHAQEYKVGLIIPQKALYYKKLANKRVQCLLCPRGCVVSKGNRGFCRTRENRSGEYYTLVHSNPCAVHIDPIEKKPLFQFLPGTTALSLATAGCNFTCKNCQNWEISQASPDDTNNIEVSPKTLVNLALINNARTIAYTYTEPTVFFEYMLETARIAKEKGVLNIYHSNGYISNEPLMELIPYLDGANVDLKAFSNEFYQDITGGTLNPVLETLKTLKKNGVWLEITNLVIPTKNDSGQMIKDLCQWVRDDLGEDTPVHFSRFHPLYKLQNLPATPIKTLRMAAEIARNSGLQYIYIGNVPGIPEENTYCPKCNKVIIGRIGYTITEYNLNKGKCKFCRAKIPGRWK
jgi:pyruvate formate lyase activating enzyme